MFILSYIVKTKLISIPVRPRIPGRPEMEITMYLHEISVSLSLLDNVHVFFYQFVLVEVITYVKGLYFFLRDNANGII